MSNYIVSIFIVTFITTFITLSFLFYKISVLEQKLEISKEVITSLEKKSQALGITENLVSAIQTEPTMFSNLGEDLILLFSAMAFFGIVLFFKKNFDILDIVQKQNADLLAQNLIVEKNLAEIGNLLTNVILVESDVTQKILSSAALVPVELLS